MLARIVTYKSISEVSFPVYKLPTNYKIRGKKLINQNERIIDDLELLGDTLGARRILIHPKDRAVMKVCALDYSSLLRVQPPMNKFIDSKGQIYIYKKTRRADIVLHPIDNIQYKDTYSLVTLKGVEFPFIISKPPELYKDIAEVVYLDNIPWKIYDFVSDLDKRRSYILL